MTLSQTLHLSYSEQPNIIDLYAIGPNEKNKIDLKFMPIEKKEKNFLSASAVLCKYLQEITTPTLIRVLNGAEVLYYFAKLISNNIVNPKLTFEFIETSSEHHLDFKYLLSFEAKKYVLDVMVNKKINPFHTLIQREFKLSICMTTYNRIYELEQTLDRLSLQTDNNFELIVINDGSDKQEVIKNHVRIKEKYFIQNKRWIWFDEKNNYLGYARNLAASRATGTQILFIDDDNIPELNMVEKYRIYWQMITDNVLVSAFDIYYESHPKIKNKWFPFTNPLYSGFLSNTFADAQMLIDKDLFHRMGGYTTDRDVGFEDWEFYLKLYLAGVEIFTIPDCIYTYRFRNSKDSMRSSTSMFKNHQRALRIINEKFPRLKNSNLMNIGLYFTKART